MPDLSPERIAQLERLAEEVRLLTGAPGNDLPDAVFNLAEAVLGGVPPALPALLAERETQRAKFEGLVGVLCSNQDTLLHKVPRTEAVRLQLEINLAAIGSIIAALAEGAPAAPVCICSRFSDLPAGTIIADLTCPIHGVNGTDPGDVLLPEGAPDA